MANVRVKLTFPEQLIKQPLLGRLDRMFDVLPNIRRANIEDHFGWIVCELTGEREIGRQGPGLAGGGGRGGQPPGRRRRILSRRALTGRDRQAVLSARLLPPSLVSASWPRRCWWWPTWPPGGWPRTSSGSGWSARVQLGSELDGPVSAADLVVPLPRPAAGVGDDLPGRRGAGRRHRAGGDVRLGRASSCGRCTSTADALVQDRRVALQSIGRGTAVVEISGDEVSRLLGRAGGAGGRAGRGAGRRRPGDVAARVEGEHRWWWRRAGSSLPAIEIPPAAAGRLPERGRDPPRPPPPHLHASTGCRSSWPAGPCRCRSSGLRRYQSRVPARPLKGPTTLVVIQPP